MALSQAEVQSVVDQARDEYNQKAQQYSEQVAEKLQAKMDASVEQYKKLLADKEFQLEEAQRDIAAAREDELTRGADELRMDQTKEHLQGVAMMMEEQMRHNKHKTKQELEYLVELMKEDDAWEADLNQRYGDLEQQAARVGDTGYAINRKQSFASEPYETRQRSGSHHRTSDLPPWPNGLTRPQIEKCAILAEEQLRAAPEQRESWSGMMQKEAISLLQCAGEYVSDTAWVDYQEKRRRGKCLPTKDDVDLACRALRLRDLV